MNFVSIYSWFSLLLALLGTVLVVLTRHRSEQDWLLALYRKGRADRATFTDRDVYAPNDEVGREVLAGAEMAKTYSLQIIIPLTFGIVFIAWPIIILHVVRSRDVA